MSSENFGASAQTEGQQREVPPAGTYPSYPSYPSYPQAYPATGGATPYPYFPPYAYYPPPMAVQLSSWAITSLICAIVGLASLNIIAAALGAIFGHVALREIKNANGWREGHGMAMAGTIIGYVALGLALLVIAFYVLYFIFIISLFQSIPTTPPTDLVAPLLGVLQLLR
jgi:Domain of unknown function (DUF4190)